MISNNIKLAHKVRFLSSCLVLLAVWVSSVAQADVIATGPNGFIVKNEITTERPAQEIWQALTQDIDRWWPKDHSWWRGEFSINPTAGGCFCETAGENSAEHMRISMVVPAQLLRMTGGLGPLQKMGLYGALDWQIGRYGSKHKVTLLYSVNGFNPEGFESLAPVVDNVQSIQLQQLQKYLAQPAQ